jgi:rhomboid protease GluP
MSLNSILLLAVFLSSGAYLYRLVRYRALRRAWDWTVVVFSILVITASAAVLSPASGGYIAGFFWALFMVIPSLGTRLLFWLHMRQRFKLARAVALTLRVLHPAGTFLKLPYFAQMNELAEQGRFSEAHQLAARHIDTSTLDGVLSLVFLLRAEQRWEEIVSLAASLPRDRLLNDPNLGIFVRALGETGNLESMLEVIGEGQKQLRRDGLFDLTLLLAAAFLGNYKQVEHLSERVTGLPDSYKKFWLATASAVAGEVGQAETTFRAMLQAEDRVLRFAAQRRISTPLASPAALSPQAWTRYQSLIETQVQIERFGSQSHGFRPLATYSLIAACCVVYLVELAKGDSTDPRVLYQLGGLVPLAVSEEGEWWRLFSAQFLHAGFMHLLFNMLCLYDLSPYVERTLGRTRFLLLYLICGTAAIAAVVGTSFIGISNPVSVVVGASGGIMAIIGMNLALFVRAWFRERVHIARERFGVLLRIVALQIIIDFFTPQISSTAHLAGLCVGFLCTLVIPLRLRLE